MIALDVSGSMLAKDFKPNRLHASKDIAIDFVNDRINDRIGIVVFAGEVNPYLTYNLNCLIGVI